MEIIQYATYPEYMGNTFPWTHVADHQELEKDGNNTIVPPWMIRKAVDLETKVESSSMRKDRNNIPFHLFRSGVVGGCRAVWTGCNRLL